MSAVSDLLLRKGNEVTIVGPDDTVLDAAKKMNEKKIGAVVVVQDEKIVGIFTERDILTRVVASALSPVETKVADVMTTPVKTVSIATSIDECEVLVTKERIRHLPVEKEGKLAGMISSGDLLLQELAAKETVIEELKRYMFGE